MVINTRIVVAPDGAVSVGTALQVGDHAVRVEVAEPSEDRLEPAAAPGCGDWPTLDLGPWPEGISLRREDIYGDDGR